MRARLATIIFFGISLATLAFGVLTALVLIWLAVVASAMLVHERAPRQGSRRFWSWAQLVGALGLPALFCLLSVFAVAETAMFGRVGSGAVLVMMTPLAGVSVAAALALRRVRGVVIAAVAGALVMWLYGGWQKQPLDDGMIFWLAIASLVVAQFVSAVAPAPDPGKPSLFRQFGSEVWATSKPNNPVLCAACGRDLRGPTRETPCRECGTMQPRD